MRLPSFTECSSTLSAQRVIISPSFKRITLRVSGSSLHAESTDGDMYAAIDLLMDKLDRQVLRHKDRIKTHGRAPLKHQQVQSQQ